MIDLEMILQLISGGGDLALVALAYFMLRLERRLLTVEWIVQELGKKYEKMV